MSRRFTIAGAGLAGLACGYELVRHGAEVALFDRAGPEDAGGVARFAGGMLAPFCEGETAEEPVVTLGASAAGWWERVTPVCRRGTLVLTPPRDRGELHRFARRTSSHCRLDADAIAALEPDLGQRFAEGLFFADEAHLNPRRALADLAAAIRAGGGQIHYGQPAPENVDIDCTGIAALLPDLRPVRGEMAILHCPDVTITRTLRLLHPRIPVYLVPRGDGIYMIGGTMVESSSARPATLRSLAELFSACFALHPAFAEAAVLETGSGLRPAFPDNLPRVFRHDRTWHLNGLYRHGFLLAPAMARQLVQSLLSENENEYRRECRTA